MTERNIKAELCHYSYIDMEHSHDQESIDYDSLITIIEELITRIEKLEEASNG